MPFFICSQSDIDNEGITSFELEPMTPNFDKYVYLKKSSPGTCSVAKNPPYVCSYAKNPLQVCSDASLGLSLHLRASQPSLQRIDPNHQKPWPCQTFLSRPLFSTGLAVMARLLVFHSSVKSSWNLSSNMTPEARHCHSAEITLLAVTKTPL